jgi:hypothetical protein
MIIAMAGEPSADSDALRVLGPPMSLWFDKEARIFRM